MVPSRAAVTDSERDTARGGKEGGGAGEQLSAQCGRNLKRQWPVVCGGTGGEGWISRESSKS